MCVEAAVEKGWQSSSDHVRRGGGKGGQTLPRASSMFGEVLNVGGAVLVFNYLNLYNNPSR